MDKILRDDAAFGELIVSNYKFPPRDDSVHTQDRSLPSGIKIRIYQPPHTQTELLPTGIFIHGGGFILGCLDSEDAQCRLICRRANVILISVDYRLAPEHRAPSALDDCVEAYRWIFANADHLCGDLERAFICGFSAGGNLAIACAMKINESTPTARPVGLISIVPITCHPSAIPARLAPHYKSYVENSECPMNTRSGMMAFFGRLFRSFCCRQTVQG